MILYTSGTTAMPKGCVLSHEALVRPAYAMRDRFALTDEDRMWDALPLFHLARCSPCTPACSPARPTSRCAASTPPKRWPRWSASAARRRSRRSRRLARDPQPPELRVDRPQQHAARAQRRHPRAARADAGDHALGDADLLLRLHRTRRRVRVRPHRGPARAARHDVRAPVPGHGDPDHRPRDRRAEAGRRDRRDHLPRPLDVQRLLPRAGADGRGRSTTRASSTPATSARSTPTAASRTAAG